MWNQLSQTESDKDGTMFEKDHVVWDSWTILNVSPAKIMQVNFAVRNFNYILKLLQQKQVLFWYSNQDPPLVDSSAANETWEYLQAFINYMKLDSYPMIK